MGDAGEDSGCELFVAEREKGLNMVNKQYALVLGRVVEQTARKSDGQRGDDHQQTASPVRQCRVLGKEL